jgi:hypothetical protein
VLLLGSGLLARFIHQPIRNDRFMRFCGPIKRDGIDFL